MSPRSALGQEGRRRPRLYSFVDKLEAIDDKTFRMTLKKPYGMVLESLGKTNSSVAVIMRAQDAADRPAAAGEGGDRLRPLQVRQGPVGAGQQGGLSEERRLWSRPSSEKAESFAGSKFPGVDRIELVWISDPQTAMSALINGEIDFYENPNIDFYPILEKARASSSCGRARSIRPTA